MAGKHLTIITGGSRGIGHCLVQSCLADMDVLNISRKPAKSENLSSRGVLLNLGLDLQEVAHIEQSLGAWLDDHPDYEVKTLIHNAAILNLGWLDKISPAEAHLSFQVNVFAPLAVTSTIFKRGRFSRTGCRVAYVTSSLGRPEPALSFAGIGLYSMTKAALGRMALIQAREFELAAPYIKIVRIHPGIVDTDIQHELRHNLGLDPAFIKKTEGLPPYQEGDWDNRSPKDHMRTISSALSAEFILWATRSANPNSAEYDFYNSEEFHAARAKSR